MSHMGQELTSAHARPRAAAAAQHGEPEDLHRDLTAASDQATGTETDAEGTKPGTRHVGETVPPPTTPSSLAGLGLSSGECGWGGVVLFLLFQKAFPIQSLLS